YHGSTPSRRRNNVVIGKSDTVDHSIGIANIAYTKGFIPLGSGCGTKIINKITRGKRLGKKTGMYSNQYQLLTVCLFEIVSDKCSTGTVYAGVPSVIFE